MTTRQAHPQNRYGDFLLVTSEMPMGFAFDIGQERSAEVLDLLLKAKDGGPCILLKSYAQGLIAEGVGLEAVRHSLFGDE